MNVDSYSAHFDKFCDRTKKDKAKILELACGPGNVTRYLKSKLPTSEIIAIDLAPRMVEIAQKTVSNVDFRVMDVKAIKSLNSQFDSIMCSFCLPFLSKNDTYKLISDCSESLVNDGILYVSTMEGDELKAGFETTSFSGGSKVFFNYHLQQDLEKALTENGFTIEYNIRQDYHDPDGSVLIDLIVIARKN